MDTNKTGGSESQTAHATHFWPGLAVIFFATQMAMLFYQAPAFLSDPGTGWHLRNGALILEQKQITRTDPFSWTASGTEWVTFEWLSDVLYAAAEKMGGLVGVSLLGLLLFAWLPFGLFRRLIRDGAAFPVVVFYVSFTLFFFQWHVLARPHAFTYSLMVVLLFWGQRTMADKPWRTAMLFAVWANLHGGFLAGLAWWGAGILGDIFDGVDRKSVGRSLGAGALAWGATLLNPWGWHLHLKIAEVLFQMKSLRLWEEFAPPSFSSFNGPTLALVLLVLAIGGSRFYRKRSPWSWNETLIVAVFFFMACRSQRHVFLLLLVAAQPVARDLTTCWKEWMPAALQSWGERWREREFEAAGQGWWAMGVALILAFAAFRAPALGTLRIGEKNLSAGAVDFLNQAGARYSRTLTTTRNGGTLIYYRYPARKVSFDDRSDFYGDRINFEQFVLQYAQAGWREILRRGDYDAAVLAPGDPLAIELGRENNWHESYRDRVTVIYEVQK